jgi:hypothetical protein
LEVSPLRDAERDRIIGSVEMATRIDPAHLRDDRTQQEHLLRACLMRMIDDGFTRSRVLLYVDATKSLRGFAECCREESGKIGPDFRNIVVPFDECDRLVFAEKTPQVRRYSKKQFGEQLFAEVFKKKRAPRWGEFPLFVKGRRKLGKIVVDKYTRTGPPICRISRRELASIRPYAAFIEHLLGDMTRAEAVERRDVIEQRKRKVIDEIAAAVSSTKVMQRLTDVLPLVMPDVVFSAHIRVPDRRGERLLLNVPVGDVPREFPKKAISTTDGRHSSALAYCTHQPIVAPLSVGERKRLERDYAERFRSRDCPRYEAKCSVPVILRNRVLAILCVQGSAELADQTVLESLQGIASVAAGYVSPVSFSRERQVLVLGQDTGLGRAYLARICGVLIKNHYEPLLLRDKRDIPELSLEDKARVMADQCRFVIMEDSLMSAHIAEARTCANSRTITAILREKHKEPNYMLCHYPFDLRFVKEFRYGSVGSNESLEATVEAAVRWAEGLVRKRIKFFNNIYPWRETERGYADLTP